MTGGTSMTMESHISGYGACPIATVGLGDMIYPFVDYFQTGRPKQETSGFPKLCWFTGGYSLVLQSCAKRQLSMGQRKSFGHVELPAATDLVEASKR